MNDMNSGEYHLVAELDGSMAIVRVLARAAATKDTNTLKS